MTSDRPAARVLCLDAADHVLLLRWRDPVSGRVMWEPPGGGVAPGETPLQAARRELTEETGLPGDAVIDRWVPVHRDFTWAGVRYVKVEPCYLARFAGHRPHVAPAALTAEETGTWLGFGWFSLPELAGLPELDPPGLAEVIRRLTGR